MFQRMLTQEYVILAELNLLSSRHPGGVYALPDPRNPLSWQGLISVRSGYFHGGIFPFKLQLPPDFPCKFVPRIFLPKGFYHPYVDLQTGELSMKPSFVHWNTEKHHLWHLLHHMRNLLTSPTSCILEHSAEQLQFLSRSSIYEDHSAATSNQVTAGGCSTYPNPEAADLIVNHKTEFGSRARHCVGTLSIWCETKNFSAHWDDFIINIDGWKDESFVQRARRAIQSTVAVGCDSQSDVARGSPGYSWVDPKTMAVFSSEASTPDTLDA
ncbi:hypothetical protein FGIG_10266 [Fasciola gigantica]|uniref:UBC core domain-containing protein n=1 Tax=Fasciola gigantica TaxID=46835 RepID=A0A504YWM5_FASGI|nr:hypothetical protein FGIG_10266 [Fasciola gigantica]